jgi:peptidoglycan hydrolase-like protein with peptidoglycan-binding domain
MRPAARGAFCALALVLASSVLADGLSAAAARSSDVAALQVALRAKRLYAGPIDGLAGAGTERALRRLQRRAGIDVDGAVGPATRTALGRLGFPQLGRRPLVVGRTGWDVAELQFQLAWHGFPSGTFDGVFGAHTEAALRRFQRYAGLEPDGLLGPRTLAALRSPPLRVPVRMSWPLSPSVTGGFGPRGARFHAGIDVAAPRGTSVASARAGRVAYAAPHPGGWGLLVSVAHGRGVRSLYAHLSRIDVRVGDRVRAGSRLGLVGSTGHSTAPHLHFEVRVRGAAVDPLPALR